MADLAPGRAAKWPCDIKEELAAAALLMPHAQANVQNTRLVWGHYPFERNQGSRKCKNQKCAAPPGVRASPHTPGARSFQCRIRS